MPPTKKIHTGPAIKRSPRGRKPKIKELAPAVVSAQIDVSVASTTVTPQSLPDVAPVPKPSEKKYFYAVGRRKTAVAKIKLMAGSGQFSVNQKDLKQYLPTVNLQELALAPLNVTNQLKQVDAVVVVTGGGKQGQADSIRHGLARALILMDPGLRLAIKKLGFLTRDPRVKERKKFGLKGARRRPQWQKR